MKLLLYGVSENTVSMEDHKRYVVNQETVHTQLNDLRQNNGVEGIVVLYNDYRTEYYLHVDEDTFSHGDFLRYLSDYSGKAIGEVILETYSKFNTDAIRHLLFVLSGMDSEKEDEDELLMNAEEALRNAEQTGNASGLLLRKLFQKAIHFTNQVQLLPSMAPLHMKEVEPIVKTFLKAWPDLTTKRFLLAGESAVVIQMAKSLFRMGCRHITIANSDKQTSKALTKKLNDWTTHFSSVASRRVFFPVDTRHFLYNLSSSDGIVVSDEEADGLLSKEWVQKIKEIRPYKKKQLMIDLSDKIADYFPDNAEAFTLYTSEVLSQTGNNHHEKETARKVFEETVELEAENVFEWYQKIIEESFQDSNPVISMSQENKSKPITQ